MIRLLLVLLGCGEEELDDSAEWERGRADGCEDAVEIGESDGRAAGLACLPRADAKRCGSAAYGLGYGDGYDACFIDAWNTAYLQAWAEAGC